MALGLRNIGRSYLAPNTLFTLFVLAFPLIIGGLGQLVWQALELEDAHVNEYCRQASETTPEKNLDSNANFRVYS